MVTACLAYNPVTDMAKTSSVPTQESAEDELEAST